MHWAAEGWLRKSVTTVFRKRQSWQPGDANLKVFVVQTGKFTGNSSGQDVVTPLTQDCGGPHDLLHTVRSITINAARFEKLRH